jgi:uncharacterized protein
MSESLFKMALRGNHREVVRNRVMRILDDPVTRSARVDWFGGEPLMAFAVIRDLARSFMPIVKKRELGWTSTIITNGALLDHRKVRALSMECGVTHAEITIDGPPEIHNRHRPLKSGQGSFWNIVRAIRSGLDDAETSSMTFGIRTNVDVHNEDHVTRLLRMLADEGLAHPRVRFKIACVHAWGNDVSELQVRRDRFARREIEWMNLMHEPGLHFEVLPRGPARVICTAVSRSNELITTVGDVFSCTEQPLVTSLEHTKVGTLAEGQWGSSPRPEGQFDSWHNDVLAGVNPSPCASCELYASCGGGPARRRWNWLSRTTSKVPMARRPHNVRHPFA